MRTTTTYTPRRRCWSGLSRQAQRSSHRSARQYHLHRRRERDPRRDRTPMNRCRVSTLTARMLKLLKSRLKVYAVRYCDLLPNLRRAPDGGIAKEIELIPATGGEFADDRSGISALE